jgi:murein DD-endopeptidase MepM/ murein hydrolase activator NlpD
MRVVRAPQGDISQFFGENLNSLYARLGINGHNGLDIVCPTRTPVLAAHDGYVEQVFNESTSTMTKGYGVHLRSDEGHMTVYWHMLPPNVKVGDRFNAGDALGYSDNSGDSTGPHLHFGLYPKNADFDNGFRGAIDPTPYLRLGLLQRLLLLYTQLQALKRSSNIP